MGLEARALHDLPDLSRQTMDEFRSHFDGRAGQRRMHSPDAPTDTASRFENRYPDTCLRERLRAC
jgi:hypothetical protein